MGKKPSKVANVNANGNGMARVNGTNGGAKAMPASYVMICKMEGCGHCTTIQQQIEQLKAQDKIRVPVYSMMEADAKKNPTFAALMSQAFQVAGEGRGFPLLFRVRNGQVQSKADVQLGASTVEKLEAFVNGL